MTIKISKSLRDSVILKDELKEQSMMIADVEDFLACS
jgi:hypothetical protein